MDFSNVKKIKIKVGDTLKEVKQIANKSSPGEPVIWKGTWSYTINLGLYVSKVKYSVDNVNWTSITSATTVEVDSEATLYIKAETYSSEARTYQYSYTMTDYNFDITRTEANDGGSVTVYRTATPVVNTYSISGTYTNGSLTYYKESTHTTVITSAKYGDTVYYIGTPNTGYSGDISGSFVVNETNMTLNKTNLTATKNYGSATRINWTYTINLGTGQSSAKYKIDNGSYISITSNTTVSSIDYASTLTIVGVGANEGYIPDTSTYTRTYSNAGGLLTLTATRITWSLAVTQGNYIASWTYKIGSQSAVSKTSNYTISNIDYADSVVITATNQSGVEWNYGTPTGTGTFSYGSTSTTLASTRSRKSYTITFALGGSNYGSWGSATKTAEYGDILTRSGNTVTCTKWNDSTTRWTDTFTNSSATEYDYSVSYSSITSPVTSMQTITATTSRTRKSYIITFTKGSYGSWSNATLTGYYGDTISRNSNVVTIYKWDATSTARSSSIYALNSDTAQYTYSNSYSTITSPITSAQTITSTDTRTVNKYTITWKNWDGSVLETDTVAYGTTPTYDGSTPTKPSTNTQIFTFNGWDSTIAPVTGNKAYTAQYTASTRYYTVTLNNQGTADGNVYIWRGTLKNRYEYGETLDLILSIHGSNYVFTGEPIGVGNGPNWYVNGNDYYKDWNYNGVSVESDMTLQAITRELYYQTVNAGDYVSTVRVKSGVNGTWSAAGSTRTTYGFSDTTLYWEMVSYDSGTQYDNGYIYTYSGDISGNFKFNTGGTYTASRTRTGRTTTVNVYVYAQRKRTYAASTIDFKNMGTDGSLYDVYNAFFNNGNYIDLNQFQRSKFYYFGQGWSFGSETQNKSSGTSSAGSVQVPGKSPARLSWDYFTPTSQSNPYVAYSYTSANGKLYSYADKYQSKVNPNPWYSDGTDFPISKIALPCVCMYNSEDDDAFYVKVESMGRASSIEVWMRNYEKDWDSKKLTITSAGTYWLDQDQYYNTGKKFYLKISRGSLMPFQWNLNSVSRNGTISAHSIDDWEYGTVNLNGVQVAVICDTLITPSISKVRLKRYHPSNPFYICD